MADCTVGQQSGAGVTRESLQRTWAGAQVPPCRRAVYDHERILAFAIGKGIAGSPFDESKKRQLRRTGFSLIWGWTALVWILSLMGMFSFHDGDSFPRFLLPLFTPVLIGVFLLFKQDVRTILDNTPLSVLAGVQTFRFAGFAFIIIAQMGILPMLFVTGGYGDILTGALALLSAILLSKQKESGKRVFLAFSAVGLIDLLNVAFLLLKYYPIWYSAVPNSAPAAMVRADAGTAATTLSRYAAAAATVVTGGSRFGMTTARPKTR